MASTPRVYAALDDRQAHHQATMVEIEDKVSNYSILSGKAMIPLMSMMDNKQLNIMLRFLVINLFIGYSFV